MCWLNESRPLNTVGSWRGANSCYLPFHGMKATCIEDVFRHLPLLVFVEAFIYEVDLSLLPLALRTVWSHLS